jgi:3-phosphoshikimate 1-carboxyvinyltransferase
MDALVYPSFVKGEVNAPPSKSYTIRAIAAAMLAAGKSTIINPSSCDDALAMLNIAHSFRAEIKFNNQNLEIQGGLKSNPEIIQ